MHPFRKLFQGRQPPNKVTVNEPTKGVKRSYIATATTQREEECFQFRWTLQEYSKLLDLELITSPEFEGPDDTTWRLLIKKKVENPKNFGVFLTLMDSGGSGATQDPEQVIKTRFEISILDSTGSQTTTKTRVAYFKTTEEFGWEDFAYSMGDKDTLTLQCKGWVAGEWKHEVNSGPLVFPATAIPEAEGEPVKRRKEEIGENLENLVQDSNDDDAVDTPTDVANDGAKKWINAEKGVLTAPELLAFADKYGLSELKKEHENFILEKLELTTENAAEALLLSERHNAKLLKARVVEFITRNKEAVKKTPSFQELAKSNPSVFANFCRRELDVTNLKDQHESSS